jgi:hypothetical protein
VCSSDLISNIRELFTYDIEQVRLRRAG